MLHTFKIAYKVYDVASVMVKPGSMICKRKANEEVAKRELEAYLKRTVPKAHRVVFISCVDQTQEKEEAGVLALARKVVGDRPKRKTQKELHEALFGNP